MASPTTSSASVAAKVARRHELVGERAAGAPLPSAKRSVRPGLRPGRGGAETLRRAPASQPSPRRRSGRRRAARPPRRQRSAVATIGAKRSMRIAIVAVLRARQAPRQALRNPSGSSPPPCKSRAQSASSVSSRAESQAAGGDRRAHRRCCRRRRPDAASSRSSARIASRSATTASRPRRSACRWRAPPGSAWRGRAAPAGRGGLVPSPRRGPRRSGPPRRCRPGRRTGPGTLASNGNWCSSRSQNAWIVWIFSPPGVSSARGEEPPRAAQLGARGGAALHARARRATAPRPAASPIGRACRRCGASSPRRRPW